MFSSLSPLSPSLSSLSSHSLSLSLVLRLSLSLSLCFSISALVLYDVVFIMPVIEPQFDQIKLPGQQVNYFMCSVLGKLLMPAYLHGKDLGQLPMLNSLTMTSGVTLCRWYIVSAWTCPRTEHPSS